MKNKPGYIDNESKYNGIFNGEHKLCPALIATIEPLEALLLIKWTGFHYHQCCRI
jgi:hypothetical protein